MIKTLFILFFLCYTKGRMLPVYFLSIVLNALMGYLFAFGGDGKERFFSLNLDETGRLVIGGLGLITGILKLLSPVRGDIPVVGDLVPALANLAGGFILCFEFYRSRTTVPAAEQIDSLIEKHKRLAGFICMGAAAVHLVFHSVLFL